MRLTQILGSKKGVWRRECNCQRCKGTKDKCSKGLGSAMLSPPFWNACVDIYRQIRALSLELSCCSGGFAIKPTPTKLNDGVWKTKLCAGPGLCREKYWQSNEKPQLLSRLVASLTLATGSFLQLMHCVLVQTEFGIHGERLCKWRSESLQMSVSLQTEKCLLRPAHRFPGKMCWSSCSIGQPSCPVLYTVKAFVTISDAERWDMETKQRHDEKSVLLPAFFSWFWQQCWNSNLWSL